MKTTLENSLQKAMTYKQYREKVTQFLSEGKSTTINGSEELVNYSKLNESRMKRLDKTFQLTSDAKQALEQVQNKYIWLVITEGWCGDASQIVPIMHKVAESSTQIDLKIVLRDENEELMDLFLTNKARAIPKLIVLNPDTLEVLKTWGPRPQELTAMVKDYKNTFGTLDATFKKDMQLWYNSNKGTATVHELLELLNVVDFF